jgi:septum formation protein
MMKIILASKSPRRKELLSAVCESFEIITSEADETLPAGMHPKDGVALLAERKGSAVMSMLEGGGVCVADSLIISSDTLVEKDGVALGKPTDENDAFSMLKTLSGKRHNVHTGVCIHYAGKVVSGTATTAVYFREMTDGEIWEYIKTGEPMDKAGAYGIQGLGGKFVEKTEGDYDTVVGLSMNLTKRLAKSVTGEWIFGICEEAAL